MPEHASSCSALPWEQVASTLAALVSHTCYYWAADTRAAAEARAQLELARQRIADKEEALSRAAAIAAGLRNHAAGRGVAHWRGPGRARDGGGLMAADVVSP